jgi:hypothetical protein
LLSDNDRQIEQLARLNHQCDSLSRFGEIGNDFAEGFLHINHRERGAAAVEY